MRRINLTFIALGSVLWLSVAQANDDQSTAVSLMTGAAMSQSCPEESAFLVAQAEGQQAPSGEVQERGVPPKTEGMLVQGDQLKAMPGYVLEKGPNNQVTARRAGGGSGGLGATVSCACGGTGAGTCTLTVTAGNATCKKEVFDTCSGLCRFVTIVKEFRPIPQ